jgi:hypothetical protein
MVNRIIVQLGIHAPGDLVLGDRSLTGTPLGAGGADGFISYLWAVQQILAGGMR